MGTFRVRNRGSFSTGTWTRSIVQMVGTPPAPKVSESSATFGDYEGYTETIADTVTPNFRKVQAEGRISNNPMRKSYERYYGSCSGYVATFTHSKGTDTDTRVGDYIHSLWGKPALPGVDFELLASLKTQAATTARAGVESPEAQGMVFIAELRKTLSMLRKPLSGLQRFIADRRKWERYRVRGLRRVQAARARTRKESLAEGAEAASSSWTEARFGWRPFLMETEAILNELFRENVVPRKTSRGKQTRIVEKTFNETKLGPSGVISITFLVKHETRYEVRSGILYDYTMSLRDALGFSWQELPAAAWELIPFSFVVDWFLNVGNFISSITPKIGVRHLAEFETVRITRTVSRVPISMTYAGWTVTSPPYGVHTRVYESFERTPIVSPSGLVFEYDITQALRGGRAFDATALIHQLFLKFKKKA